MLLLYIRMQGPVLLNDVTGLEWSDIYFKTDIKQISLFLQIMKTQIKYFILEVHFTE